MKLFWCIQDKIFPWTMMTDEQDDEPEISSEIDLMEKHPEVSLEIANRIHDAEVHRRGSADTKAALYLAFLAAILPLIGTLKPGQTSSPFRWSEWAETFFFCAALIYLVSAAIFVMRSLSASMFYTLGEKDLHRGLRRGKPAPWVAHQTLLATLHNYRANNHKISLVNCAQRHLFRAILVLTALVSWSWFASLITSIEPVSAQHSSETSISSTGNAVDETIPASKPKTR